MGQQVGDQLSNYRLTRLLGAGGFAEVWLGKHQNDQREAAIKVLKVQLPTVEDQTRFLNEAHHLERLIHQHIVKLLDCGMEGDTPYLILEYAPNGTLRQRHPRNKAIPVNQVIYYVKQIAAGLQYAHNSRIIHRDVKPENMLLNSKNEILLGDFGIALPGQTLPYPKTQDIMGTSGYMAPEQWNGHPVFRSDQYSLAVVVYEWLCGSLPFTGGLGEIVKQQQSPPPSLKNRAPGITSAMEQVIFKALSYDMDDRYRRVEDFANELEQAASNPNWSRQMPLPNNPLVGVAPQSPIPQSPAPSPLDPTFNARNIPGINTISPPVNNIAGPANIPNVNNFPAANNMAGPANIAGPTNFPGVNNIPGAANFPGVNNIGGANNMAGPANFPGVNNMAGANNVAAPGSTLPAGGNQPGVVSPFIGNGLAGNTPIPPTPPVAPTSPNINTPPNSLLNASPAGGFNNPPINNQPPGNIPPSYNQPPNNMPPHNPPQSPVILPDPGVLGAGGISPFNQPGGPFGGGGTQQQTSLHSSATVPAPQGPWPGANPFDPNAGQSFQMGGQIHTNGPTSQSNWLAQLFDRNFMKQSKNQLFLYGGGAVDFLLAVALGFWLNAGDLSWRLWLGSFIVAWVVRALCAAVKPKYLYLAFPLALALAFYWFVGSWALGTNFQNTMKFEPVPPDIIALLAFFAALFLHCRYVLDKKKR